MVSIPFKRESIYQLGYYFNIRLIRLTCFHSLQTGKHISTEPLWQSTQSDAPCFDSLQTGKHISTRIMLPTAKSILIRFDSLQTGKHISTDKDHRRPIEYRFEFRFPSNGKAYINFKDHATGLYPFATVSIPFKRESIYQPKEGVIRAFEITVSIPFKRESIYQLCLAKTEHRKGILSFDSLQTGKHISTQGEIQRCLT